MLGDANPPAGHPRSAPFTDDSLLDQYKTYILDTMPVTLKVRNAMEKFMALGTWPTVWQSLRMIEGCKVGRNWEWDDAMDILLYHLRIDFNLPWTVLAEYLFIGMRPKQCERRYEARKSAVEDDLDKVDPEDAERGRVVYGFAAEC